MTGFNGGDATLADRIASRGRDALVQRLRTAYADAAAANADLVSLGEDRIEALVQSAADRADGLQWRRALAQVACQELGVSLAQALTHPAVREAQERLGAPSYEAGLAELVARPVPPPAPAEQLQAFTSDGPDVEPPAEPAPIEQEEPAPAPAPAFQPELMIGEREPRETTGELEEIEADDEIFELLPPPEPVEEEASGETYGETSGAEHTVQPPPQEDSLQVLAYHLGGVANLPTGRDGLDLRLSESGLDILQREGEIIGRLHWEEIDALEVVAVRGRLRRQARTLSRIVVRTKHGDASFEIPGLSSEDLEARVEPLVSRYASA